MDKWLCPNIGPKEQMAGLKIKKDLGKEKDLLKVLIEVPAGIRDYQEMLLKGEIIGLDIVLFDYKKWQTKMPEDLPPEL